MCEVHEHHARMKFIWISLSCAGLVDKTKSNFDFSMRAIVFYIERV